MDCALNGLLRYYVLIWMLLKVQWRAVVANPIPSCNLASTKSLTAQLTTSVNGTLAEYEKKNNITRSPNRDDVPTSSISGTDLSEKLQDIYVKNVIFSLHILKVREYQKQLLNDPQSVVESLTQVKGDLSHHLDTIKAILIHTNSLPTTAAPPQLSHSHDYEKKQYGRAVLVSLKDWLTQVQQALSEETSACGK